MKLLKTLAALLFGLTGMSGAMAADVPSNLIVNAGGMEWAWAAPCSPVSPTCNQNGDLVMHDGWNLASASDFTSSFTGLADLSAQFDAGAKCASAYFNSGYSHCDNGDVLTGVVWNLPAAWGTNNDPYYSETFVVRAVPEPETYALMVAGLALVGFVARRRQGS